MYDYVLTAAHMVVDDAGKKVTSVTVNWLGLAGATAGTADLFVHPGWTGNPLGGNDLAVVRISQLSSTTPDRYELFRDVGTGPARLAQPELPKVFTKAGDGLPGTGAAGYTNNTGLFGTLRVGQNRYDDTYTPTTSRDWRTHAMLAYDFDNGTSRTTRSDSGSGFANTGRPDRLRRRPVRGVRRPGRLGRAVVPERQDRGGDLLHPEPVLHRLPTWVRTPVSERSATTPGWRPSPDGSTRSRVGRRSRKRPPRPCRAGRADLVVELSAAGSGRMAPAGGPSGLFVSTAETSSEGHAVPRGCGGRAAPARRACRNRPGTDRRCGETSEGLFDTQTESSGGAGPGRDDTDFFRDFVNDRDPVELRFDTPGQ